MTENIVGQCQITWKKLSGFLVVWGVFGGGLVLFCFVLLWGLVFGFVFVFDSRATRQAKVLLAGDLYFSSPV